MNILPITLRGPLSPCLEFAEAKTNGTPSLLVLTPLELQAKNSRDSRSDVGHAVDRCQRHEIDAIREKLIVLLLLGDGQREARLAHAAGTDDGDRPRVVEHPAEVIGLGLATEQRIERVGQRRRLPRRRLRHYWTSDGRGRPPRRS